MWEASRTQELFDIAKKDYPDIKSIDDAICQADRTHFKRIPDKAQDIVNPKRPRHR